MAGVRHGIEAKIRDALAPAHLEVINESYMHSVPPGSESHFKLIIVSDRFEGEPRVKRHQRVNRVLAQELKENIHALALQTLTPSEWARRDGATPESPPCLGGSKAES
ncbi:MAG: BolA family transcriptional regulator [Proteobacteria bacterium]|nr:BolA family transcriptional regulator [Pseudomonadota bacterium]